MKALPFSSQGKKSTFHLKKIRFLDHSQQKNFQEIKLIPIISFFFGSFTIPHLSTAGLLPA